MRHPDIVSFRAQSDHIELTWPDGTQQSFLYVWLRDNCPTSRHRNGQKTIETYAISRDIVPEEVSLNELGVLEIKWQGEDHVSYFDVEVLKRKSAPPRKWTSIIPPDVITWDARLDINELIVDFETFMTQPDALYTALNHVVKTGFVLLKNAPANPSIVLETVRRFGHVRETNYGTVFHVKNRLDPENLADTTLALSPHTDNPYRDPVPTLQLLHCLESSLEGGDSIFVDGFRVAEHLYDMALHQFNMLATTPVSFRFRNEKVWLEAETTFLGVDASGYMKHIRLNNRSVRPFNPNMHRLAEFYKAYFALMHLTMDADFQVRFKMEPGDLVLFDNERLLHGRTGFPVAEAVSYTEGASGSRIGAGNRHLVGCYADRDGLLSTWRVLRRQQEGRLANAYTIIQ